jgi:hypothetical protein
MTAKRPNVHKIIPTSSIAKPSKIYPNWNFGFEKLGCFVTMSIFKLPIDEMSTKWRSVIWVSTKEFNMTCSNFFPEKNKLLLHIAIALAVWSSDIIYACGVMGLRSNSVRV